jgi:hypothetical protein
MPMKCPDCGATAQRPVTVEAPTAADDPLAAVMKLVEDRNPNGIPDAFEGMVPGANVSHKTVVRTVSTTFSVNGRTYKSVDEMPPEIRRRFEPGNRQTFSVSGSLSFNKSIGGASPAADPAQRRPGSRVALILALAVGFLLLLALALAARAG